MGRKTNRLKIREKAKEIIKENFSSGDNGLYDGELRALFRRIRYINNPSFLGDPRLMTTLYRGDELIIDICYSHRYFEVFGLTGEEFRELNEYYKSLRESEEV